MSKHPSWEAWSAWVDGESDHPEALQRHLEQCDVCAEHVKHLKNLTSQLGRAPVPEVSPALLARVMAHVAETAHARKRPWWRRTGWPALLATAAVLVAVAGIAWRMLPSGAVAPNEHAQSVATQLAEAMMDYHEAANSDEVWEMGMADDVTPEDLLEGAVQTDTLLALAKSIDEDEDLDGLVASLDPGEAEAFHGLVREYAMENETL